jgi:hypothetical protein
LKRKDKAITDENNGVDIDILSAQFDDARRCCINNVVETQVIAIAARLAEERLEKLQTISSSTSNSITGKKHT